MLMIRKIIPNAVRRTKRGSVERERLVSLINSMADGVIAVDMHMKIVTANGAAQNVLDSNSTLVGRKLSNVFQPIDKNRQPVDIEALVANAKLPISYRDYLISYADGSVSNLYISIAPVHLGYGKLGMHGYVLLLRDITREKSLEEERNEFISVISHELRTPIAISEGNISNAQFIAEKTGDIEQVKTALQAAHNQILFLSDMVNDLATLSRAERGKLVLEITSIDVSKLVDNLQDLYQSDATAKNLTLDVTSQPDLHLQSSELYVREILQNFITNAIKYSNVGGVSVTAVQHDGGVMFTVSDTGIGISKSDQERVFDKFFRSEDYRTRKNSGTGLGLYVTIKLARLLNAEITLESELNKGSKFSIFIPNIDKPA